MKPADIDTKYDHGGDNPDYPQRLLVKIEDYIDAKHGKRQATEVVRETSNDCRFLEQDAAQEHLNLSAPSSWNTDFFGEGGLLMNKAEQAVGSRPKARRLSSQSLGSEQDESPAQASDLMVERLRACEEVRALCDKTEMAFQQTRAKIKDEAGSWEFHVVLRCTSASCYMSPPSRRYALLLKTILAPRCFQLPTGVPFVGVLVMRVLLNSTGPYLPQSQ